MLGSSRKKSNDSNPSRDRKRRREQDAAQLLALQNMSQISSMGVAAPTETVSTIVPTTSRVPAREKTPHHADQRLLNNVVNLCEEDEAFAEAITEINKRRTFDEGSKDIRERNATYTPDEKKTILFLVDAYQQKHGGSRRAAIHAIQDSMVRAGNKPPSYSLIYSWQLKVQEGVPFDKREVNEDFEVAVMAKLYRTELEKVWAEGHTDPKSIETAMKSIVYTAAKCKAAAESVAAMEPFNTDSRVVRIKKFESTWSSIFLNRMTATKFKAYPEERTPQMRPSDEVVMQHMGIIQETISSSGLPADNIFSADETGIFLNAQYLHKFIKSGAKEGGLNGLRDCAMGQKRLSNMAAISASGESLPPFLIVPCASKKADLSDATELDDLMVELQARDGEDVWQKQLWEFTCLFPNRKTRQPTETTFKRPFLLHKLSGAVVTCQYKSWMDRVALLQWCDTVIGPWTGVNGGNSLVIWDHCKSHTNHVVVEHFEEAGISLVTLPPDMADLLQVMHQIFTGPFRTFLKNERLMPVYESFLMYKEERERDGEGQEWTQPAISMPDCVESIVKFVDTKNEDQSFRACVHKSFIMSCQWYDSVNDRSFAELNLEERIALGPEGWNAFGKDYDDDDDDIIIGDGHRGRSSSSSSAAVAGGSSSVAGITTTYQPPELMQSYIIQRPQRDEEEDLAETAPYLVGEEAQQEGGEEAQSNGFGSGILRFFGMNAAAGGSSVAAVATSLPDPTATARGGGHTASSSSDGGSNTTAPSAMIDLLKAGPRILRDSEIDRLAEGSSGPANIKCALQLRGEMRTNGFTRKNLPFLVAELKDMEHARLAERGGGEDEEEDVEEEEEEGKVNENEAVHVLFAASSASAGTKKSNDSNPSRDRKRRREQDAAQALALQTMSQISSMGVAAPTETVSTIVPTTSRVPAREKTPHHADQRLLNNVVNLCEEDEAFAEAITEINKRRTFDEGSKDIRERNATYTPDEKKTILFLVDAYQQKHGGSRRAAIHAIQDSMVRAGNKPPSYSLIYSWQLKVQEGVPFDKREVNEDFEVAVMAKLYRTELEKVWAEGHTDPKSIETAMKSIVYTAAKCKAAAESVAAMEPFNTDSRVVRIKKFESTWSSIFLNRMTATKFKAYPEERTPQMRPSDEVVMQHMGIIQETISSSGLPADNIFSADETGIFLNAQYLHKFIKSGAKEGGLSGLRDCAMGQKRLSNMAAISASGESLPPFLIVPCASKKADLSDATELDDLMVELQARDGEDVWQKQLWEFTCLFPNRKTRQPTETTFKRPFLLHKLSGAVVTCQYKSWMDRVALLQWCDTVIGPWTGVNGGNSLVIWDHCKSHTNHVVVEHFEEAGISLVTLPPDMADLLQVMHQIFTGPFRTFLKNERLMPVYESFLMYKEECGRDGEGQEWTQPAISMPDCVESIVKFVDAKNEDQSFRACVHKSFIMSCQWYDSVNDRSFAELNLEERIALGPEGWNAFGKDYDDDDDDIIIGDGHRGLSSSSSSAAVAGGSSSVARITATYQPPELMQSYIIQRPQRDEEEDLAETAPYLVGEEAQQEGGEEAQSNGFGSGILRFFGMNAAAGGSSVAAVATSLPDPTATARGGGHTASSSSDGGSNTTAPSAMIDLLKAGPRILRDSEIDRLAEGSSGPANIKCALQLRGDLRTNGFTRKNLPFLVAELKDMEHARLAERGGGEDEEEDVEEEEEEGERGIAASLSTSSASDVAATLAGSSAVSTSRGRVTAIASATSTNTNTNTAGASAASARNISRKFKSARWK